MPVSTASPSRSEAPPNSDSNVVADSSTAPADERFYLAALAILIVGIALRQFNLGVATFHPDEAIHAWFSMGFATYTYDPVYHGPLLYHLVAATMNLLGFFDFTARLVPSLLGIGLLAIVLGPARAFLTPRQALWSAGILAISPSLVAYSRHLLHDALVLVLTLGSVLLFAVTLEKPSNTSEGRTARIGLLALLALFLATKANVFFILVMLAAFWIAWRLRSVRDERKMSDDERDLLPPELLRRATPLLCFALVTAAAILLPRDNGAAVPVQEWQHRIFSILAVSGCAVLWLWLFTRPADSVEREVKTGWRRTVDIATYLLAIGAALWLYAFLFGKGAQIINEWATLREFPSATFAQGRESAQTAIQKMLDYWGGQQGKPRLPGRHDYYVTLGLLYELPLFLVAIGGIHHAAKNRSRWGDLLLWWAFTSWAVYAVANEKVPWLLVHIVLPLALLSGIWLAQINWRPLATGAAVLGAIYLARGAGAFVFERAGDNAEPLLYAQTPEQFKDALDWALRESSDRADLGIRVTNERQWPTVWYYRGEDNPAISGSKWQLGPDGSFKPEDSRVTVSRDDKELAAIQSAGWESRVVPFLVWPRATWPGLRPDRWARWWLTRDTLPADERKLPYEEWKKSILVGGEWSVANTVIAHR